MADLVGQIQRDIEKRLQELRPLIEEKERLEAVLAALTNGSTAAAPARAARPCHDDAPSAGRAPYAAGKGRRAPRGANREAILTVVRERPGVSAAEVAEITKSPSRRSTRRSPSSSARASSNPRARAASSSRRGA